MNDEVLTLYVVFDNGINEDFIKPWNRPHSTYFRSNNAWNIIHYYRCTYSCIAHILKMLGIEYKIIAKTESEMDCIAGDYGAIRNLEDCNPVYPDKISIPSVFATMDKHSNYTVVDKLIAEVDDIDQDIIYILTPLPSDGRNVTGYYYSDANKVYYTCKYDMVDKSVSDAPNAAAVDPKTGKYISTYEEYKEIIK